MKNLKLKITAIMFAMVGLFAMSTENIKAFQPLEGCDTLNPNVDPDGPTGEMTTECKLPLLVECCIQNGEVTFFGREQKITP